MPNRILREGILCSERINQLTPLAELFYRRLMSVVDDWGRFSANLTLLRTSCYRLRPDEVKEQDVAGWLKECEERDLLFTYEAGGKRCLELTDFRQQRRAKTSKFPDPCTADAKHVSSTCVSDAQHMLTSAHFGGGGGGGVGVCEGGGGAPSQSVEAHWPDLDQVLLAAAKMGLPDWKAELFYHKFEAMGWRMNGQDIKNWHSLLVREKGFWEQDGKPKKNEGKYGRPSYKRDGKASRSDGTQNAGTHKDYEGVGTV